MSFISDHFWFRDGYRPKPLEPEVGTLKSHTEQLEDLLIDHTELLRREIQQGVEEKAFYPSRIQIDNWPKAQGLIISKIETDPAAKVDDAGFGVTTHTISLKKMALNSRDICLDDLKTQGDLLGILREVRRVMVENLVWVWDQTIQDDLLRYMTTRSISRYRPHVDSPRLPARVNLFGRRVYPYLTKDFTSGMRAVVNPKYKRAAEQTIIFNRDTLHFVFPDASKWACELAWRNIPDMHSNPESLIGYFRAMMAYAPKPIFPEFGEVVTVVPPGFRGTLWYWIWKLFRFVP